MKRSVAKLPLVGLIRFVVFFISLSVFNSMDFVDRCKLIFFSSFEFCSSLGIVLFIFFLL
jgi:hypothetical protein